MKPIRDIDYVLGLEVKRYTEHKILKISQETYAKKVLERFGMIDCCPFTCPVTPSAILEAHEGPAVDFPCSRVVGLIMNLAMDTQPDLAFNVGLVSCFGSNPKEVHVKAIKRILPCLWVMTDIDLTFGGSGNQKQVGYMDVDYVGCTLTRQSTFKYVFLYRRATLEWRSNKEECVALSTTKAEYISLCIAAKEVVWLRG
jgi:hypothetical protein